MKGLVGILVVVLALWFVFYNEREKENRKGKMKEEKEENGV